MTQHTIDIGVDTRPALALIDEAIPSLTHRNLVSTDEMTDLLLDIRSSLTYEDDYDRDADVPAHAGPSTGP